MRRPISILLALMPLLLGCTQKEPDDTGMPVTDADDMPVTFLAAANGTTRGTSMSGELDTDASFRVYATRQRKDGDNLVDGDISYFIRGTGDGDVVTYQRIAVEGPAQYRWVWKTARDYFWPQENYFVQFYAVHPASAPVIADILTDKSLTYGASNPYDGNHDLMWATAATTRESKGDGSFKDAGDKTNSTVKLQFHHVLSQIAFYGKLSPQFKNWGWTVEVGGITIHNVNTCGTGTFVPDDDKFKPSTFEFTPAEPAILNDYTMAMNTGHLTVSSTTVAKDDANKDIPLTSPTDVTMVIPQTINPWDIATEQGGISDTENGYLSVSLRIIDNNGESPVYPLKSDGGFITVYVPFSSYAEDALASPWIAGKLYKYTLTFGAGYSANGNPVIQPIKVEAAIAPWNEATVSGTIKRKKNNNI